ncbi:hypothetical protein [Desulfovibrio ferrophilus]|uniref:Uncharacterized protein n=1 Tax=Desulfovibrio ferrophilus TaxID=241368 RepID=A0A2Z6AX90_9BACT|nr:hypothetical protein [Desulfovibrio ferrophilus]BBD07813.1 uncharacterized protein DFE_1087 [Desulfovibrio ferrophilus]
MQLSFAVHGRSCDLALHPISENTARRIRETGSEVYKEKPLRWWRKGNTATWGMKVDDDCHIRVMLNGETVPIDTKIVTQTPLKLRRRMYLDSKAKYLCVLGYDNEICKFSWNWDAVTDFDPSKFEFMVHKWDRIMGIPNYYILDEIRYDGQFADRHDWCEAKGFTLVEPKVIDLEDVRRQWAHKGWDIDHATKACAGDEALAKNV